MQGPHEDSVLSLDRVEFKNFKLSVLTAPQRVVLEGYEGDRRQLCNRHRTEARCDTHQIPYHLSCQLWYENWKKHAFRVYSTEAVKRMRERAKIRLSRSHPRIPTIFRTCSTRSEDAKIARVCLLVRSSTPYPDTITILSLKCVERRVQDITRVHH